MSTPNPVTSQFPVLSKGFSWTLATTGAGGVALPSGETESTVTIGIRLNGDTSHSAGNYSFFAFVSAGQVTETPAQLAAAINTVLPAGQYYGAIQQTDSLNGQNATSAWSAEVGFTIPATLVTPAPPSNFSAS